MIYVVYRIFEDEPRRGYYWGTYEDPLKLAYACFNLCADGCTDIKIIEHDDDRCIEDTIEW